MTKKILSLDTETTSTSAIDAELVGLSFSVKEFEAFYVPVPANREEAQKIVNIFKPLYENPEIVKVGQNIKYDMEVLASYGVCVAGQLFDTMIATTSSNPSFATTWTTWLRRVSDIRPYT